MQDPRIPSPLRIRLNVLPLLNVLLAITGAVAVASLVLEYGFGKETPLPPNLLHITQVCVVCVFVFDRILRLLLWRNRLGYLKENWTDFSLMLIAGLILAVSMRWHVGILRAASLYVIITQLYILVALIIRGVNLNLRFADSGIHPARLLLLSFALLVLVGSGLLMLPAAVVPEARSSWYYIDALFTSTSATCVTGLVVKNTGAHFTLFGQVVILALIQMGGLGIMLFGTVMGMMVGKALSVRGSSALGEMLSTEGIGKIGRVARFVIIATFAFELLGAVLLLPMFLQARTDAGTAMSLAQAVWHSVFHSISAFCNAGFSLYGDNMMAGVGGAAAGWDQPLRQHWQILGVIAPLIVLGGLGFPVLHDLGVYVRNALKRMRVKRHPLNSVSLPQRPHLNLHSKIVLATTAALLIGGAALLWPLETFNGQSGNRVGRHNIDSDDVQTAGDWQQMSPGKKLNELVFLSVSSRTAGFNSFNLSDLSDAGKLTVCGLMTIGGSPASTAGGLKTITFAVVLLAAYSLLRRRNEVEVFHRSLGASILIRVMTYAVLYITLLCSVTLLLTAFMPGHDFLDLLFEACSACATVGLSTGVTSMLSHPAKLVTIAGMFIGRLGPLTLLVAITRHMHKARYSYPTENIIVG